MHLMLMFDVLLMFMYILYILCLMYSICESSFIIVIAQGTLIYPTRCIYTAVDDYEAILASHVARVYACLPDPDIVYASLMFSLKTRRSAAALIRAARQSDQVVQKPR